MAGIAVQREVAFGGNGTMSKLNATSQGGSTVRRYRCGRELS
jgi:hypothetical protein